MSTWFLLIYIIVCLRYWFASPLKCQMTKMTSLHCFFLDINPILTYSNVSYIDMIAYSVTLLSRYNNIFQYADNLFRRTFQCIHEWIKGFQSMDNSNLVYCLARSLDKYNNDIYLCLCRIYGLWFSCNECIKNLCLYGICVW